MATRMQQRRGTAAQWTDADPILAAGEIGFETDTSQFKIGDGTNSWSELSYFQSLESLGGTFDDYVALSSVGQADGVASLDATGNVPVSQLGNIIDGAPEALNTLNELAAAISDDPEFFEGFTELATTVSNVNNGLNTLTTTVSDLSGDVIAVEGRVDTLETDLGNLTTSAGTTATTVATLVTDVDTLETSVGSLSTTLSTVSTDLATVETTVDALVLEKAALEGPTFTGTVVLPSATSIGDVSATEIAHLDGVTSGIQAQIDAKLDSSVASTTYAPLDAPTFTGTVSLPATTAIGTVSATEIGHLDGVTSGIQSQLDTKAPSDSPTFTGTVSGVTKAHVGLGNVDNTSDANKPVSTATQNALDLKANLSGATFTGAVTIEGNLNVTGTTTTINATDLSVSDPLIYLASGQYDEDALDVGFLAATGVAGGTEASHLHSGLFRDVSDGKKWKLVTNVPHPVANTVDTTNATYETLVVGNLEATGVVFSDGTQTKQGVPSITAISQKTDSYTLSNLNERDTIVEIAKSTAVTLTIPTDATLNFPVGTTLDVIQTGAGQITIAGAGGVTVNGTPGLKLRTQWSSATLLKRAANTWLVYGDLTA